VTIPTTNKATTETPANTPKPIGNTSNFFPGGSNGVEAPAFSEVGVGDRGGTEGDPKLSAREVVFSGCGSGVGFGASGGGTVLLLPSPLGSGDTGSVGRGTAVSVIDTTGSDADSELGGGETVTVGSGGTVPVPERTSVLERISVEETRSLVVVSVGDGGDGNGGDSIGLVAGGGRALGVSPLPLSGVTTHVFSSLTIFTPSTTVGVRVMLHV